MYRCHPTLFDSPKRPNKPDVRLPRWLPLLAVVVLALTAWDGGRAWAAGPVTEFPLAGTNLAPTSITSGPDGALWFAENAGVGRITTGGAVSHFPHAAANWITRGPDGALWFTQTSKGLIGRVTTAGVFTDFNLPSNPPPGTGYTRPIPERPQTITVGPDGALWYTVQLFDQTCVCVKGGKIGRITTGGAITEFTLPTGGTRRTASRPFGITAGPDGALWFTDTNLGKIGRMTTGGALTQFAVPQGQPQGITSGPDGNLWFTANGGQTALLERLSPTGAFTQFTAATGVDGVSVGAALAVGPDGALWFSDYDSLTGVGSLVRGTTVGDITTVPLATFDEIDGVTAGPDGAVWFTLTHLMTSTSAIGRLPTP